MQIHHRHNAFSVPVCCENARFWPTCCTGCTSYSSLSSTRESGEGLLNSVPPSPTKPCLTYNSRSLAGLPTNVLPTRVLKIIQLLSSLHRLEACIKLTQTMKMQGHVQGDTCAEKIVQKKKKKVKENYQLTHPAVLSHFITAVFNKRDN